MEIENLNRIVNGDILSEINESEANSVEILVLNLQNQLQLINNNLTLESTINEADIPWFPRRLSDFNICSKRVLMYGVELDADHPGFKDTVYRERRKYFNKLAMEYEHGQPIPIAEYTEEETRTWGAVFSNLKSLCKTFACKEYLANMPLLEEFCGYKDDHVPQLRDINDFLKKKSGFQVRPVAGYLSARDFLAGLAFRLFHCTQYIRHPCDPSYTPEPDCCHELLGHIPLLADPSFAQLSQEIGLASLGVSEEEVGKLATCYFFTVEFGLCKQNGELKAYGAGLLSSAAELKHALSNAAKTLPFDPVRTVQQECLITTFQDVYFYNESFEEAKDKIRKFAAGISRPFDVRYNPYTETVDVLREPSQVSDLFNELKGDLCIISSALKRIYKQNLAKKTIATDETSRSR